MRWICAREALLLQGIPIFSSLSFDREVTGFASCKSSITETGRTATIGQAGNAMHSQCIAIALMYAVTQSNPPASTSVPRAVSSPSVSATATGVPLLRNDGHTEMESERERSRPRDIQPMAHLSSRLQPSVPTESGRHQPPGGTGGRSVSLAGLMWRCSKTAKQNR